MSDKKSFSTIRDGIKSSAKGVRTFITGIDAEEIRNQVLNLINSLIFVSETTFTSDTTTSGSGVYAYDTTGSTVTLTISSNDISKGRTIIVKDKAGGAGANAITVATEGNENIDGSTSLTINSDYDKLRIYTDGSNAYTF